MVTRRNSMMKAFKLKRNLIRLPPFYHPPDNKPQIDSTLSFSFASYSPFSSLIAMARKGKLKRRGGMRKQPYSRDCESFTSPDNRQGGGKGSPNSQQKEKQHSVIVHLTTDVTDQFNALNSNMEKVIIVVGVLSQAWLRNSHQNTPYDTPTCDIERMAETEAILQKFMNSGSDQRRLFTGTDDITMEKDKRLVKKLFTPPETAPEDSFWAPEWLINCNVWTKKYFRFELY
ncbi:uncharacterized protein LOC130718667 [Lotus japonicus]|uniref:uncharacterized protein LOC130718667 n=1 Tax=Lotus japonicus TaxID=34305 RepID=UPI002588729A|nr:uncharacterized protein LOC130718667 [Lotus japonicus]